MTGVQTCALPIWKSAFLAAELFSERRNAVSWFELGRDCRVLEIGSGYGALTGALADRAGTVVSFEDSEIRGAINRFRQRRHKNVAVYSGDFKDIIELADVRKFDVITLMGEGADVSRLAEYAGLLKQEARDPRTAESVRIEILGGMFLC